MEDKHKLTDQLKTVETEIHYAKHDLKCIELKLDTAYAYEEECNQRVMFAKKQTDELRKEYYKKTGEISEGYIKMKKIFDVFTGNFYKD